MLQPEERGKIYRILLVSIGGTFLIFAVVVVFAWIFYGRPATAPDVSKQEEMAKQKETAIISHIFSTPVIVNVVGEGTVLKTEIAATEGSEIVATKAAVRIEKGMVVAFAFPPTGDLSPGSRVKVYGIISGPERLFVIIP